jgi:hypothetical protein
MSLEEVFNPIHTLEAIKKYRKLDLVKTPYETVYNALEEIIFSFNLICINLGKYPVFRVRKHENPSLVYTRKSDLLAPPEECVHKMGRLNKVHESIFYAAFDPVTAIKESRIKPGDFFSLSIFWMNANENGELSSINTCLPNTPLGLGVNENITTLIISDFMYSEFTRHVSEDTNYQYKTTCAIGELLFRHEKKDSIIYPSMIDYNCRNIAFRKTAIDKRLSLSEILVCQLEDYNEEGNPVIYNSQKGKVNSNREINYTETPLFQRNLTLKKETFFKPYHKYQELIDVLTKVDEI